MSKILSLIVSFFFFLSMLPQSNPTIAAPNCNAVGVNYTTNPSPIPEGLRELSITLTGIGDGRYQLRFAVPPGQTSHTDVGDAFGGSLILTVRRNIPGKLDRGTHVSTLEKWNETQQRWDDYCGDISYTVGGSFDSCRIVIRPPDPQDNESFATDVFFAPQGSYLLQLGDISGLGVRGRPYGETIGTMVVGADGRGTLEVSRTFTPRRTRISLYDQTIGFNVGPLEAHFCTTPMTISASGGRPPRPIPTPGTPPTAPGPGARPAGPPAAAGGIPCGSANEPGFQTAIGCIHTSPVALVKDFLKFGLGIAGGLAFLMMLLGAFQMLTSAGNPETLATGKDRLTNAVIGLLFVIFATLLLQIIGFDILKLPGFGR